MFELYAAIKGQVKLLCQYRDGIAYEVEDALKDKPVNAEDAECSDAKDKKMIDAFIEGLEGGFEQFNKDIETAIRATNAYESEYDESDSSADSDSGSD